MRITENVTATREEGTSFISFVVETEVEGIGTILVSGRLRDDLEQAEIEKCSLPKEGVPLDVFLAHMTGLKAVLGDLREYFRIPGGEAEYTYTLTFEI